MVHIAIVTGANLNQLTSLGGPHIVVGHNPKPFDVRKIMEDHGSHGFFSSSIPSAFLGYSTA